MAGWESERDAGLRVDGVGGAGAAVDDVVVVYEDGLEEGGPVALVDLLVPGVDLFVSTKSAEAIEGFFESVGVVDEVWVVFDEEFGSFGEGKVNESDMAGAKSFPERGRALEAADAVGLCFGEDGAGGIEVFEGVPE